MRAVSLSFAFVLCLAASVAAENADHRRLAEHYAPVVFQESRSTVLDFITRFDYDGDWRGDNNWRNAYLFDLPGYAYYSVIESTSHYFITYAFYHPRDYTARPYEGFAPKTEHENDMEGCTPSVPESNRDPRATYDLISIEDTIWAHRFDVGFTFCCADSYR